MIKKLPYIVILLLVGCKTIPQPEPTIEYRDRVEYVDRYQRDTIYQHEVEHIYTAGDTVYVDRLQYKYKEVLHYDTIYTHQTDSIYIEKIEYVEKPLPTIQKTMQSLGWTVFIGLILFFAIKIYKLFK